jgi:hypothetical protein
MSVVFSGFVAVNGAVCYCRALLGIIGTNNASGFVSRCSYVTVSLRGGSSDRFTLVYVSSNALVIFLFVAHLRISNICTHTIIAVTFHTRHIMLVRLCNDYISIEALDGFFVGVVRAVAATAVNATAGGGGWLNTL